jgi:hypothetical protein
LEYFKTTQFESHYPTLTEYSPSQKDNNKNQGDNNKNGSNCGAHDNSDTGTTTGIIFVFLALYTLYRGIKTLLEIIEIEKSDAVTNKSSCYFYPRSYHKIYFALT